MLKPQRPGSCLIYDSFGNKYLFLFVEVIELPLFEGLGGKHQGFAFSFDNQEDGSEPICCKEGQGEKRMFLV